MTGLLVVCAVTAALILINALCVGGEFSAIGARRTRVEQLAMGGNTAAGALLPILKDPRRLDDYVAASQLGITASSLLLGSYGQGSLEPIVSAYLGRTGWLSEVAATTLSVGGVLVGLSALQIVIGELVPKAIATRSPERVAMATLMPMRLILWLFRPLILIFNGTGTAIVRLVGIGEPATHAHLHSPEEIELLVTESTVGGELDPVERQMLHNAFDLSQMVARQVMIPRNRLELADVETPIDELLDRLARSPFSRIPVYRDTHDHILGIVHLKDLFRIHTEGQGTVGDIVRPVPAVPETLDVGELWQILTQKQHYLAIVIDEYGGTAGLVTQEDLVEEIIGEIRDEFDVEGEPIVLQPGGEALVRGDLLVEEVNEALDLDLPTDVADSVGGLVVHELSRLAKPGDVVDIGETRLRVQSVRRHSVEWLAVDPPAGRETGHA